MTARAWLRAAAAALLLAGRAGAAVDIVQLDHQVDAADVEAVRWGPDGAAWAGSGGAWFRRPPGAARFEPAPPPDWPPRERAGAAPVRDRVMFGEGLRWREPRGSCRVGAVEAWWYGRAATGVTLRARGAFSDVLLAHRVRDADLDARGAVLAATDDGVYEGDRRLDLPSRAPGNALDGGFSHDGALFVYGPRGLFRMDASPQPWLSEPVREARETAHGPMALAGGALWTWPGPARSPLDAASAWTFAPGAGDRVYLAGATELRTEEPRVSRSTTTRLPAPPAALFAVADSLVVALSGPDGGLLVGPGTPAAQQLSIPARCFHAEPGRLLIGTDEGLASLEEDRLHWYFRRPGLRVSAIAESGALHLLATNEGLLALDGPSIVARLPLGAGGPDARVTALVPLSGDVWATTAGEGLYRLRVVSRPDPPPAREQPSPPPPVTRPPHRASPHPPVVHRRDALAAPPPPTESAPAPPPPITTNPPTTIPGASAPPASPALAAPAASPAPATPVASPAPAASVASPAPAASVASPAPAVAAAPVANPTLPAPAANHAPASPVASPALASPAPASPAPASAGPVARPAPSGAGAGPAADVDGAGRGGGGAR